MQREPAPEERAEHLDPHTALVDIEATRRRAHREVTVPVAPILAMWGLAWLVAFTVTFLALELSRPLAFLGPVGINAVWTVCIGGAVIGQVSLIARKTRGLMVDVRRQRSYQMMAAAWFLAMVLAGGMIAATAPGPGGGAMFFVFAVALLYLAFGAVDTDRAMFGLGAWFGLLNVAAAVLTPDWYLLAMAVLGGGAFLAVAAAVHRRERRERFADVD